MQPISLEEQFKRLGMITLSLKYYIRLHLAIGMRCMILNMNTLESLKVYITVGIHEEIKKDIDI